MIKEVERGFHDIEDNATLQELSQFLIELLRTHPELSRMQVRVAEECGYWNAAIAYPLTAVVPNDRPDTIYLVSDDDAGKEPEGWTFYREVEEQ